MKKVALVGGGMTKFGKREATYEDLISEAGKATFDSVANVSPGDIDALLVSSSMPERFAFQTHVATLVADCLGLEPKLLARVEQLCSSGSVAIRLAYSAIAAGLANMALVLGVEKMILPDMTESLLHMVTAMSGWDRAHGITAP
ncbi:MAG: beta-ketoacyl synthase N-terminal-like domain-containing protein, partial [Methanobacteriota archaeon]